MQNRNNADSAALLNTSEVAKLLRVSGWTVRMWRRRGYGPAYVRLGPRRQRRPRMIRYRRRDVEAFLERQIVRTGEKLVRFRRSMLAPFSEALEAR